MVLTVRIHTIADLETSDLIGMTQIIRNSSTCFVSVPQHCKRLHRHIMIVCIIYCTCISVSQYGSTVYIGMAMGGSALQPYIRKFKFSLSTSIQSVF